MPEAFNAVASGVLVMIGGSTTDVGPGRVSVGDGSGVAEGVTLGCAVAEMRATCRCTSWGGIGFQPKAPETTTAASTTEVAASSQRRRLERWYSAMATLYEPSGVVPPMPLPDVPAMAVAGPAMAAATEVVAADPPEKTFEPMAMKEPHSEQNMRLGELDASQLQQLMTSADTTGRDWAGRGAGDSGGGSVGAPAAGR